MVPTNMAAFSLSEKDVEAPPAPPPLRVVEEPPSVPSRTHGSLVRRHSCIREPVGREGAYA